MRAFIALAVVAAVFALDAVPLRAHSGPPFPIVSSQIAGGYKVSIWTDPDTTDDGTPAGQFWVVLETVDGKSTVPSGTQVRVEISPLDRSGSTQAGTAVPVNGAVDRQFVALLMDHEGPFGVRVTVDGSMGRAQVESTVDATYDARPPAGLIALYLFPFVAIGALWAKVLLRRRAATPGVRR